MALPQYRGSSLANRQLDWEDFTFINKESMSSQRTLAMTNSIKNSLAPQCLQTTLGW